MWLLDARFGGHLDCSGAVITNDSGPAWFADRCEVVGNIRLTRGFRARGAGPIAAVHLVNIRTTGTILIGNARVNNASGPALVADRSQIGGGVSIDGTFIAHGAGRSAAISFVGVRITGSVSIEDALLTSSTTTALSLAAAEVTGVAYFSDTFVAHGAGQSAVIDLREAKLDTLWVGNAEVAHVIDRRFEWDLNGCTYTGVPRTADLLWWLDLLRYRTPRYFAQPYQQLASVHRAVGHDGDVRTILIAQRRDQIRRGNFTPREKAWARITGIVVGYGWKPWLALTWLAGVFVLSAVLAVLLGSHGALMHPPKQDRQFEVCTTLEKVGFGIELGTPLLGAAARARERCQINSDPNSVSAAALTVSTWILQLLAWGFAALFIAGFTSAVRKS